jgi:hypothetical protein
VVFSLSAFAAFRLKSLIGRLTIATPPRSLRERPRERASLVSTPPGEGDQSLLCEPSHSGIVAVRLQVQKNTFLVSGAVNCIGENPEPLWLPSQNGWLADLPQAHHQ